MRMFIGGKRERRRVSEVLAAGWGRFLRFIGGHRVMLLVLCLFSAFSLVDIPGSPVFNIPVWQQISYVIFVSVFKALVLLSLLYPLLTKRKLRVIAWILVGIYGLMATVNAVGFYFYGMGITRKLILVFAQTTSSETAGFLPGLLHNLLSVALKPMFYVGMACMLGIIFLMKKMPDKWFGGGVLTSAGIGGICFVIFAMTFSSGRSAHSLMARTVKYSREVWQSNKDYERLLAQKRPLPYRESVGSRHLASTVVVVIGESALRSHHSLYGYPLPTTPVLDSMTDSIIVFSDAIGSSMATAGNMERILSFKEDDTTYGDGLKFPLLIDLFNEMGYKSFWLSNQERTGTVSNTSGVMSMNADVIKYVGAENSEDVLSVRYDGALLPYFCEAMNDTASNKLIFIHLQGSHVEYKSRYPAEVGLFTARDERTAFRFPWLDEGMAQRRAEYDNSIRYTDMLLREMMRKTALSREPAVLIYFSDHGEDVYDHSDYTGRSEETVEVPFIVYANKAYSTTNPGIVERLKKATCKPMSTANIVHLLITITGGEYKLYNPRLDVSSDHYEARPRYVDEVIWKHDRR